MASAGSVKVVTEWPSVERISLTALASSSSSSTTMMRPAAGGADGLRVREVFLGRAGLSSGRKTVNVLPNPGSESTVMAPCALSTRFLATNSPMPEPFPRGFVLKKG